LTTSHSPRSRRDRTRREDRHLKFYELRDNLVLSGGYGEDELNRADAFRVYRDTGELHQSLTSWG